MKSIHFQIAGTAPLLMHSDRSVNTFDPLSIAMRNITSKRKKTDDDIRELSRIEWRCGLYADESGPIVPTSNILAAIIAGAKVYKLGAAVKRGCVIDGVSASLQYEGPRDPDQLVADPAFVDIRSVKVGTSRVMRCRPVFRQWALDFTTYFDESVLRRDDLIRCVEAAGQFAGLGDYRPHCGRFEISGVPS